MDPERALRQVLLVGVAGQRAIEQAHALVPPAGIAREVATLYAERAGFAAVVAHATPPLTEDRPLEDEACRGVLEGARAAMRAVSAAVAGGLE